jgi:uncharacterized protein involved in exopolysaccharide biosynthesis
MEQDKSYLESMITSQSASSPAMGDHGVAAAPGAQQTELQGLLTEESDLTRRYTDDYPDVVAVRRKIKNLRAQMAETPAVTSAPTTASSTPSRNDSQAVQQLRAQLRSLEQGIQLKRHEQAMTAAQVRMYQDRISQSPTVLEEYKNITRDYETAQGFYDDLLKKMNQSKMATDLERRQQGEQFSVMDQPNLPDSPTFPKRGVFIGAGLFAGLALGLMLVAWREYRDTAMRSERDVWAFTKLPTLGVIALSMNELGLPATSSGSKWGLGRRKKTEIQAGKPLANTNG